VIVAGPPGSGKGTQCARLARSEGWFHLSSGELFRREIARGTPRGRELAALVDAGDLVPDDLTVEVVLGALDAVTVDGVLLDGFPRTLRQAHVLMSRVATRPRHAVRLAIELVVPPEVSFQRLTQRSRSDDDIAAIRRRLALYESQTRPALAWLEDREILVKVDGDQPPDVVGAAINRLLDEIDEVDAAGDATDPSASSATSASSA
jgi:adenylate kinase